MGDAAVAAEAVARRAAPVSITTVMAMVACQVGLHACMMGSRMALPLELLRRGHPEWQVGVLMAMFAVCPALLALPAGAWPIAMVTTGRCAWPRCWPSPARRWPR